MESPQQPVSQQPNPQQPSPQPNEQPAGPSPPVESRTREYLSNERTYLSWMRTAVSLMGIGVILGRIHVLQAQLSPKATWQLGIIFAVVGLITVFLATQHYLAIRREIADDSDTETGRWVILFSIITLLLGSGILYYGLVYSR